ncbi:hypothetical protein PFLG_02158 [Plasmodium falciparum RAJ116]|uniref:Uncharacterized protein n=1 Tax=Plasmodium falciparum RAJ116 TaxID=580058 RepID=A0A0L0CZ01_PLAFA|nr:hypothetical protein PFLG_02158 [Plasmodium falciparum RAJ116]
MTKSIYNITNKSCSDNLQFFKRKRHENYNENMEELNKRQKIQKDTNMLYISNNNNGNKYYPYDEKEYNYNMNDFIKTDANYNFMNPNEFICNIPLKEQCDLKSLFSYFTESLKKKSHHDNIFKKTYIECLQRNNKKLLQDPIDENNLFLYKSYFYKIKKIFSLFYFDFFVCIINENISLEQGMDFLINDLFFVNEQFFKNLIYILKSGPPNNTNNNDDNNTNNNDDDDNNNNNNCDALLRCDEKTPNHYNNHIDNYNINKNVISNYYTDNSYDINPLQTEDQGNNMNSQELYNDNVICFYNNNVLTEKYLIIPFKEIILNSLHY